MVLLILPSRDFHLIFTPPQADSSYPFERQTLPA